MPDQTPTVECHVLDTGFCLAHENMVLRGGARKTIECHSIVGLLRHPRHGWILWDTGYAPRMWAATRHWPFSLYRRATPLHIQPELAVIAQLDRFGLVAADVQTIIISHFHADHIAGLHDFPSSRLVASDAAYANVRERQGFSALRRAFIPALLPTDFAVRVELLPRFTDTALPGLGATHDLFGDESLRLVELPGHACGQIGLFVQTDRGPLLFAADSCWHSRTIRERRPPHPLTYLFVDDAQAVYSTIDALHEFATARPDVRIVPSHCPEAFVREVER